jgi:hypothetical protein
MVIFEEDIINQSCKCTFDKIKSVLTIRPANDGSALFRIDVANGTIPKVLAGRYGSVRKAKEAIELYDRTLKESRTVRTEKFIEARIQRKAKRNASVSKSENS